MCLLLRKLIEKVSNSHESARNAKQQMQLYKAHIVQSMNEEYKDMMRQALDEVSICIISFMKSVMSKCTMVCVITDVSWWQVGIGPAFA